jgi:hypothetical protein
MPERFAKSKRSRIAINAATLAKGFLMTNHRNTAVLLAAIVLGTSMPVSAQVSTATKVSTSNSMDNGVATQTTKVEHTKKYKTHHPKKVLGIKVGNKTKTVKTVQKTSVDSNGNSSSSVETTH